MAASRTAFILLLFALIGAVFAGMSLYEHTLAQLGVDAPSACNVSAAFNCNAINQSSYSTVLGVPLAAIGLAFYLIAATGALVALVYGIGPVGLGVFLVSGFFASLLSIYLFYISKFVIGFFCLYCLGMYISNFGVFGTAWAATRGQALATASKAFFAPGELLLRMIRGPRPLAAWLFVAMSMMALFISFEAPHLIEQQIPPKPTIRPSAIYSMWLREPIDAVVGFEDQGALGDQRKGPVGSPIEIVEYADYSCGACRRFFSTIEKIVSEYPEKVSFIPRNFPIDSACNRLVEGDAHVGSCYVAEFVRCAGEQGQFWKAYEEAYTNEALESDHDGTRSKNALREWAQAQGLDLQGIDACIASGRQRQRILAEIEQAVSLGIQGTPTIFINGRRTQPYEVEEVVAALAK